MRLTSTYSVKIKDYGKIFEGTLQTYRRAVSFFLSVAVAEGNRLASLTAKSQVNAMERMTHPTASHPDTQYHFDTTETSFLKFPSYLRRAAIMDALGSVSSYKSNFANWEKSPRGKAPSLPKKIHSCPALYKGNMYIRTDNYTAKIKVWHNNDWIGSLGKSSGASEGNHPHPL